MNQNRIDIIKIGGSVLTDKLSYRKIRKDILNEISREISNWDKPLILVHGAGSFGHIIAAEHSITSGFKSKSQLDGLVKIRQDMSLLTQEVVSSLVENGMKAIGFQSSALSYLENTGVSYFLNPINKSLNLGLSPVLSGDILFSEIEGFTINSGDSIINHIVRKFNVSQVVFLTDVDGLFKHSDNSTEMNLIESLDSQDLKKINLDNLTNNKIDVTGSMKGKISEIEGLLKHVEKVTILNGLHPERLNSLLNNKEVVSTTILGEKSTQR